MEEEERVGVVNVEEEKDKDCESVCECNIGRTIVRLSDDDRFGRGGFFAEGYCFCNTPPPPLVCPDASKNVASDLILPTQERAKEVV